MYWWRVIDGIYTTWEAEKHKPEEEQEGFDYGRPDLGDDPLDDEVEEEPETRKSPKRRKGGLRKPVLPRDKRRH